MPFRYLRDPLFLACLIGYFLNRFVLKHLTHGGFFHDSFNDLICIPFWLPLMLWGMRRTKLRSDDAPPRGEEILIPLLLWSYVFEIYLPRVRFFSHLATSDYRDIFCYTAGAFLAMLFWRWYYRARQVIAPAAPNT
jgi:hypothetical protein